MEFSCKILNQRWRDRQDFYRRPGEEFRTHDYEVAEIEGDTTAQVFVRTHHYSGSYPAARWRFGLYRRGQLAGVAVFSHPVNNLTLTNVFGGKPTDGVELGRFVLLDDVPYNGETWFLARAFELLRPCGLRGVVSFSDPVPRVRADGTILFKGHVGTIYQAFSHGIYLGRSTTRMIRLYRDGTQANDRTVQKIRTLERGWQGAVDELRSQGAGPFDPMDPRGWLRHWLPRITTAVRHAGCHRYAWAFHHKIREALAEVGRPYPKQVDPPGIMTA